ncbi:hypothetical protein Tco_1334756 [Tanacetum coccineum]
MAREDEFHDDNPPSPPPPVTPTQQAPYTLSTIKLPILKKEDHLEKFYKMTDAKDMWEAIKSRFSGNDESNKMQKYILKQQFESFSISNSEGLHKGYDRFQSLLSQLEIRGAGVSTEDANQKFLRSLPSSWSQVSLIMRTKPRVDSLSFDDLYNNLRVFESDVKGSTRSSSSTQNVAFVSFESTSSTNDVSTAYGVSTSSGYNSQRENSSSYTDELINGLEMASGHDFNKIEEVLQEDKKKAASADQKGIKILGGEMQGTLGGDLENKRNLKLCSSKGLSKLLKSQMSAKDKYGLGYGDQIHKGVLSYENEVFQSVFDSRSSDVEDSPVYDSVETLEFVPEPVVVEPKVVSQPKVWSDAPIIEEYESDNDDEYVIKPSKEQEKHNFAFVNTIKHVKTPRETVKEKNTCSPSPKVDKRDWNGLMSKKLGLGYGFTKKACFVCGSFSHLIRDCNFHEKRMAKQVELNKKKGKGIGQGENRPVWNNVQRLNHQNKFVPKVVLTKTGIFPVNIARKIFLVKQQQLVLLGKLILLDPLHMTRNKAYLVEYQDYNGGLVAFRGSKGQITGKDEVVVQFVVSLVEERFICWMDNSS